MPNFKKSLKTKTLALLMSIPYATPLSFVKAMPVKPSGTKKDEVSKPPGETNQEVQGLHNAQQEAQNQSDEENSNVARNQEIENPTSLVQETSEKSLSDVSQEINTENPNSTVQEPVNVSGLGLSKEDLASALKIILENMDKYELVQFFLPVLGNGKMSKKTRQEVARVIIKDKKIKETVRTRAEQQLSDRSKSEQKMRENFTILLNYQTENGGLPEQTLREIIQIFSVNGDISKDEQAKIIENFCNNQNSSKEIRDRVIKLLELNSTIKCYTSNPIKENQDKLRQVLESYSYDKSQESTSEKPNDATIQKMKTQPNDSTLAAVQGPIEENSTVSNKEILGDQNISKDSTDQPLQTDFGGCEVSDEQRFENGMQINRSKNKEISELYRKTVFKVAELLINDSNLSENTVDQLAQTFVTEGKFSDEKRHELSKITPTLTKEEKIKMVVDGLKENVLFMEDLEQIIKIFLEEDEISWENRCKANILILGMPVIAKGIWTALCQSTFRRVESLPLEIINEIIRIVLEDPVVNLIPNEKRLNKLVMIFQTLLEKINPPPNVTNTAFQLFEIDRIGAIRLLLLHFLSDQKTSKTDLVNQIQFVVENLRISPDSQNSIQEFLGPFEKSLANEEKQSSLGIADQTTQSLSSSPIQGNDENPQGNIPCDRVNDIMNNVIAAVQGVSEKTRNKARQLPDEIEKVITLMEDKGISEKDLGRLLEFILLKQQVSYEHQVLLFKFFRNQNIHMIIKKSLVNRLRLDNNDIERLILFLQKEQQLSESLALHNEEEKSYIPGSQEALNETCSQINKVLELEKEINNDFIVKVIEIINKEPIPTVDMMNDVFNFILISKSTSGMSENGILMLLIIGLKFQGLSMKIKTLAFRVLEHLGPYPIFQSDVLKFLRNPEKSEIEKENMLLEHLKETALGMQETLLGNQEPLVGPQETLNRTRLKIISILAENEQIDREFLAEVIRSFDENSITIDLINYVLQIILERQNVIKISKKSIGEILQIALLNVGLSLETQHLALRVLQYPNLDIGDQIGFLIGFLRNPKIDEDKKILEIKRLLGMQESSSETSQEMRKPFGTTNQGMQEVCNTESQELKIYNGIFEILLENNEEIDREFMKHMFDFFGQNPTITNQLLFNMFGFIFGSQDVARIPETTIRSLLAIILRNQNLPMRTYNLALQVLQNSIFTSSDRIETLRQLLSPKNNEIEKESLLKGILNRLQKIQNSSNTANQETQESSNATNQGMQEPSRTEGEETEDLPEEISQTIISKGKIKDGQHKLRKIMRNESISEQKKLEMMDEFNENEFHKKEKQKKEADEQSKKYDITDEEIEGQKRLSSIKMSDKSFEQLLRMLRIFLSNSERNNRIKLFKQILTWMCVVETINEKMRLFKKLDSNIIQEIDIILALFDYNGTIGTADEIVRDEILLRTINSLAGIMNLDAFHRAIKAINEQKPVNSKEIFVDGTKIIIDKDKSKQRSFPNVPNLNKGPLRGEKNTTALSPNEGPLRGEENTTSKLEDTDYFLHCTDPPTKTTSNRFTNGPSIHDAHIYDASIDKDTLPPGKASSLGTPPTSDIAETKDKMFNTLLEDEEINREFIDLIFEFYEQQKTMGTNEVEVIDEIFKLILKNKIIANISQATIEILLSIIFRNFPMEIYNLIFKVFQDSNLSIDDQVMIFSQLRNPENNEIGRKSLLQQTLFFLQKERNSSNATKNQQTQESSSTENHDITPEEIEGSKRLSSIKMSDKSFEQLLEILKILLKYTVHTETHRLLIKIFTWENQTMKKVDINRKNQIVEILGLLNNNRDRTEILRAINFLAGILSPIVSSQVLKKL